MTDTTPAIEGEFICVVCPNGCAIDAEFIPGDSPKLIAFSGAKCPRGEKWLRQEIESPMRTIATSVLVRDGDYICASVRTKSPIPLAKVRDVMNSLRGMEIDAPVRVGQTIIVGPAGTDTEIIATRDVAAIMPI
ncbi:MAG: DUF1667 domain-containing protein [Synergistaceae bacterium]|jgi:CxxC motif-containing protein|nr:DUF1667 domain-containing protein [Synergistaceae bacterium]